jgi:hypothetical protein
MFQQSWSMRNPTYLGIHMAVLTGYHIFADMCPQTLLPLWRKVCCRLLSPWKIHCLGPVSTCKLWVQWQAQEPLHHRVDMIEILIGKIQLPFLTQILPILLLGVSAATTTENAGGWSGMIRTQMVSTIDQKMVTTAMGCFVRYHPITVTSK